MLNYINNQPYVEGVLLDTLTQVQKTPFYVYSQKKIKNNYKNLYSILDSKIFYSVKANSNQAILKLMHNLGAGADVVSIGELKRVLHVGMPARNIILEGVGKSKEDILYAIQQNIRQINIESFEELNSVNEIANSLNKIVKIGIRLNPDVDGKTIDKISTGKKTDKFGVNIDEIGSIVSQLKNYSNIELVGISCHIGSQIFNIKIYGKVFEVMKNAAKYFIDSNIKIKHVDLGGGIGVQYQPNDQIFNLNNLKKEIDINFKNVPYDISFEPGRYLIANAGILATSIVTTKINGGINYLITDAGMNTLIRPALYNTNHSIVAITKKVDQEIEYTIAGPICESSDIFVQNIKLPKQETGNILIIKDVGAYGAVMASNYNSRGLPAEILVDDINFSIIHKPIKIEEYINLDLIPNWLV